MAELEAALGHGFARPELLVRALTHRSLANERGANERGVDEKAANGLTGVQGAEEASPGDNERLEFLGDAVLGLVVAEALYHRFPSLREGDLTSLRASLVSSRNLAQIAQRIELGPMLRLGRGEEHSGGHKKPALLANAVTRIIALWPQ